MFAPKGEILAKNWLCGFFPFPFFGKGERGLMDLCPPPPTQRVFLGFLLVLLAVGGVQEHTKYHQLLVTQIEQVHEAPPFFAPPMELEEGVLQRALFPASGSGHLE